MADQQLVNYISESLKRGVGMNEIRAVLLQQGWMQNEVDDAIDAVKGPPKASMPVPAPKAPAQQVQTEPTASDAEHEGKAAQPLQKPAKAGISGADLLGMANFPFLLSLAGGIVILAMGIMYFMGNTAFINVPLIDGILLNSIFGMACGAIIVICAAMLFTDSMNLNTGVTILAFSVLVAITSSDLIITAGAVASAVGGAIPAVAVLVKRKK